MGQLKSEELVRIISDLCWDCFACPGMLAKVPSLREIVHNISSQLLYTQNRWNCVYNCLQSYKKLLLSTESFNSAPHFSWWQNILLLASRVHNVGLVTYLRELGYDLRMSCSGASAGALTLTAMEVDFY